MFTKSTNPGTAVHRLGGLTLSRPFFKSMKARGTADPATLEKPGVEWSEVRNRLETLDMIQFRGWDWISRGMLRVEQRALGAKGGRYTHVALVMRGSDFPKTSPYHNDTKLYAFECTDPKEDGVTNFNGKKFSGVQLRDLDAIVPNYDRSEDTELAWMRMHDEVRPDIDPEELERVVERYLDRKFDWNPLHLFGALYKSVRPWRNLFERTYSSKRLFCSQLTALVLRDLGVLASEIEPLDVLPSDFRSLDRQQTMDPDEEIPVLFDDAKTFTAYPRPS